MFIFFYKCLKFSVVKREDHLGMCRLHTLIASSSWLSLIQEGQSQDRAEREKQKHLLFMRYSSLHTGSFTTALEDGSLPIFPNEEVEVQRDEYLFQGYMVNRWQSQDLVSHPFVTKSPSLYSLFLCCNSCPMSS